MHWQNLISGRAITRLIITAIVVGAIGDAIWAPLMPVGLVLGALLGLLVLMLRTDIR